MSPIRLLLVVGGLLLGGCGEDTTDLHGCAEADLRCRVERSGDPELVRQLGPLVGSDPEPGTRPQGPM